MKIRKNVKDLTSAEKAEFMSAILTLKNSTPSRLANTNRYDDYVSIHDQARGLAHNGPAFGPWHREFIRQFERDLQIASGNNDLRLPYWDWTTARDSSDPGWPFTDDFMGSLGVSATDSRVTTGVLATDPADPAASQFRINIRDNETGDYLKRRGGPQEINPDGSTFTLPSQALTRLVMTVTPYEASPYNSDPSTLTDPEFQAQAFASFRKILEWGVHNGPHPWVGRSPQFNAFNVLTNADLVGSMTWQASPNDPIFFLHHCNVDRLWAIWQQRYEYPGYLPISGAEPGHNRADVMGLFDDPADWNDPVNQTPESLVFHRAIGPWYDTDLPVVTLSSPSITFGEIPQDLTTYRPLSLLVLTPRIAQLRIVSITASGTFAAAESVTIVNPTAGDVPVPVDVYLSYIANGPLSAPEGGTAVLEIFIDDDDGYYSGTAGTEYIVESIAIDFTATTVGRDRTALALVLDRSGSMGWAAGGGRTRFELLAEALLVMRDTMVDNDGLTLVTYDNLVDRVFDVLPMTPAEGRSRLTAALTDGSLTPRNGTGIGAGMIEGANALQDEAASAASPYTRHAMIVMTDGNENIDPSVTHTSVTSAISPFADQVFAIGLGRPEDVSETTLGAISTYMAVTGDMSESERRFRLIKYFSQVLADATGADIIVDPEGALPLGAEHAFAFDIADTELTFDVIVASPYAYFIDLSLVTPGGAEITQASAGPNTEYQLNLVDSFFRVQLPALPDDPDTSHAGVWKAVLRVNPDRLRKILHSGSKHSNELGDSAFFDELRGGVIRYTAFVQTRSNLRLKASAERSGALVGADINLTVRVLQYDVAITRKVAVVAHVTRPDGALAVVGLTPDSGSTFRGTITANDAGLYTIRFRASGSTRAGHTFSREAVRTVAVYRAAPQPPKTDDNDQTCELLACLLADKSVRQWLMKKEIDIKKLEQCLRHVRGADYRKERPALRQAAQAKTADLLKAFQTATMGMVEVKPIDLDAHKAAGGVKLARKTLDLPREFMPILVGYDGKLRLANRPPTKKKSAKKNAPKKRAVKRRAPKK